VKGVLSPRYIYSVWIFQCMAAVAIFLDSTGNHKLSAILPLMSNVAIGLSSFQKMLSNLLNRFFRPSGILLFKRFI